MIEALGIQYLEVPEQEPVQKQENGILIIHILNAQEVKQHYGHVNHTPINCVLYNIIM